MPTEEEEEEALRPPEVMIDVRAAEELLEVLSDAKLLGRLEVAAFPEDWSELERVPEDIDSPEVDGSVELDSI